VPAANDELFMERDALGLIGARVDQTVIVKAPAGTPQAVQIAGSVHDRRLAPATEKDSDYGYVSDTACTRRGCGIARH
jgi:putative ABC transport system permease protein